MSNADSKKDEFYYSVLAAGSFESLNVYDKYPGILDRLYDQAAQ